VKEVKEIFLNRKDRFVLEIEIIKKLVEKGNFEKYTFDEEDEQLFRKIQE
jgi:hypothetical protein